MSRHGRVHDRRILLSSIHSYSPLMNFMGTACVHRNFYMLMNNLIIFGRFVDKVLNACVSKTDNSCFLRGKRGWVGGGGGVVRGGGVVGGGVGSWLQKRCKDKNDKDNRQI